MLVNEEKLVFLIQGYSAFEGYKCQLSGWVSVSCQGRRRVRGLNVLMASNAPWGPEDNAIHHRVTGI
ncbi:hypothetical protein BABINDRAFT_136013 [Babjeviella inositovora NRRL Y-12698]|uniref:Uncharacterized protein n=1 Tax=Babjeviella inositovora NRRL Y-12698 TaxID=984486 RepID=A0A1E3QQ21_9ASCO|nr:uncharacterized protein BABINDRAFT_136013 [Babjeviella inositovora NRRL Y-12698]ODQ79806.1 hypothetical protein BABINDRAFT_136013 [Babjeviella inositovora NRRL Y-12698]